MERLIGRRGWIFDLDGTLTVSVHDFAALRAELGIPPGHGLLEYIAISPPEQARAISERIAAWEAEHAELSTAEPDALRLLHRLYNHGCRIGVLTRNLHGLAIRSLEVAGITGIAESDVIGRDDAPAKPDPAGVNRLLAQWNLSPGQCVMVGDWGFDIEAGRAAGVATVLIDRDGSAAKFATLADVTVTSLDAVTEALR